MRGLGGFVLLAGIGVGLFVYFPAPVDRDTSLEQAKRVVAERVASSQVRKTFPVARDTVSAPSRVASFSSPTRLAPTQKRARVPAPVVAAVTPPLAAVAKVEPMPAWQTNVVPAATVAGPLGSLDPTDPESRYKLVVDIQQQLKRVGCYWGRANGSWNNSTRDAMRTFTSQANAALPVDKPDYMLLSLLKSHNGRSCGAPETTTVAAPPRGQPQVVAAAQPEVLPWKAAAGSQASQPLYKPLPSSVVETDPLPGRMAIGGPKNFPPATQAPLIPGATSQQPGVATAALDPGSAAPADFGASRQPAAAPKPRAPKRSARRSGPGTPRYNLMLSLGGVY
ncbi:MAG: hypothetical protein WC684_03405 [Hyphomicrobium sp.]|jgi:hypothetical protein